MLLDMWDTSINEVMSVCISKINKVRNSKTYNELETVSNLTIIMSALCGLQMKNTQYIPVYKYRVIAWDGWSMVKILQRWPIDKEIWIMISIHSLSIVNVDPGQIARWVFSLILTEDSSCKEESIMLNRWRLSLHPNTEDASPQAWRSGDPYLPCQLLPGQWVCG